MSALTPSLPGQAPTAAISKREHFQNADITYGWVQDRRGNRLRTFATRPKGIAGKLPAIFFVGWLSCDSVEYPHGAAWTSRAWARARAIVARLTS